MAGWETDPMLAAQSEPMRDFAQIWQAAEKIVYSTTLETASTRRTRIEREFDPEAVGRLKASAGRDVTVGGPNLAAHALEPGWLTNATCSSRRSSWGGGKRSLPDQVHLRLELLAEKRFDGGMVHLRYRALT